MYSARDEVRVKLADKALQALIKKDEIIKKLKEEVEKERNEREAVDNRAQGMAATMNTLALELGIGVHKSPGEKTGGMDVDEEKTKEGVEEGSEVQGR